MATKQSPPPEPAGTPAACPQPDCPEPPGGAITARIAGTDLCVIDLGPQMLAHLLKLIDGAQTRLDLYYYIFAADDSGTRVRDALIAAASRGVAVTLLIDAFGSSTTPAAFFAPLTDAGARFGRFGAKRSTRYLIRNHQKLAIADDARLMIGGFNVADAYFGESEECWRDVGLWVEGAAVAPMVDWYKRLAHYVLATPQRFGPLRRLVRGWHGGAAWARRAKGRRKRRGEQAQSTQAHGPQAQDGPVRWLVGGPTRRLSPWARCVKADLTGAKRLDMIEAYFSPGPAMLKRLDAVARRGAARLVMAARSDNGATVAAARFLYGGLLRKGAEIYEYSPCRLHMKLIVVDDIVYIGSANFDMRSLFLNLELMLRIEDADFAAAMRGFVTARIAESRRITPALHRRREGPLTFLKWWLSYLAVGVLDYTVTRRLNFRSNGYQ